MDAKSSERFMTLQVRNSHICLSHCFDPQTFILTSSVTPE